MHQIIKNHRTWQVIFEGPFATLAQCAEAAAGAGITLDGADFGNANLINASLDGASLRHARFTGANLMGANLSEADLSYADFSDSELHNACLCYSTLHGCRFVGTSFGGTDITGCRLDRSLFSTLSAFGLNFQDAASMNGCSFLDGEEEHCLLSRPPIVITGLRYPVVILDHHIRVGGWMGRRGEFMALLPDGGQGASPIRQFCQDQQRLLRCILEGDPEIRRKA